MADRGPISRHLAAQLRDIRNRRQVTQQQLGESAALPPTAIGKIENGTRDVTVEELLRLALALNVSPASLIVPGGDSPKVRITADAEYDAAWVRDWLAGLHPLPPDATKRAVELFFAEAPDYQQREHRASMHPALLHLATIRLFMRDSVLWLSGEKPDDVDDPRLLGAALLTAVDRLRRYSDLLVDELDALAETLEPEGGAK
jgi:transcriptional regulator with XRE-family HTH domain